MHALSIIALCTTVLAFPLPSPDQVKRTPSPAEIKFDGVKVGDTGNIGAINEITKRSAFPIDMNGAKIGKTVEVGDTIITTRSPVDVKINGVKIGDTADTGPRARAPSALRWMSNSMASRSATLRTLKP